MATKSARVASAEGGVNIATALTGNNPSPDILDRHSDREACLLRLISTIGATPTVNVTIQGSMDGTNWRNVPYGTQSAPETVTQADIVITTATTTYAILRPNHPWRYLRINLTLNTNVTITADVFDAAR